MAAASDSLIIYNQLSTMNEACAKVDAVATDCDLYVHKTGISQQCAPGQTIECQHIMFEGWVATARYKLNAQSAAGARLLISKPGVVYGVSFFAQTAGSVLLPELSISCAGSLKRIIPTTTYVGICSSAGCLDSEITLSTTDDSLVIHTIKLHIMRKKPVAAAGAGLGTPVHQGGYVHSNAAGAPAAAAAMPMQSLALAAAHRAGAHQHPQQPLQYPQAAARMDGVIATADVVSGVPVSPSTSYPHTIFPPADSRAYEHLLSLSPAEREQTLTNALREVRPHSMQRGRWPVDLKTPKSFSAQTDGAANAVAVLVTPEKYATAFLIAPRLVMTNMHCVSKKDIARSSKVTFGVSYVQNDPKNNQAFRLSVHDPTEANTWALDPDTLYWTGATDVAIVALKPAKGSQPWPTWPHIRLEKHDPPQFNSTVYLLHHPSGLPQRLSTGLAIGVSSYGLEHTADAVEASSGGPLFDEHWQLVGLHRADFAGRGCAITIRSAQSLEKGVAPPASTLNVNLAVPITDILKEIPKEISAAIAPAPAAPTAVAAVPAGMTAVSAASNFGAAYAKR